MSIPTKHSRANETRMMEWLSFCAERQLIAPSYGEIAHRFEFESIEQARTLIAQLSDAGMIRMKPAGRDRFTFEIKRRERAPAPEPLKLGNLDVGLQELDEKEAGLRRIRDIHEKLKSKQVADPEPVAVKAVLPPHRPKRPEPVAPPPKSERRPALPNLADDRQVNIRVSRRMYERLAAIAHDQDVEVGNAARSIFHSAMLAPTGKPLVKGDVYRAWQRDHAHLSLADFCTMLMDEGLLHLAIRDDGK